MRSSSLGRVGVAALILGGTASLLAFEACSGGSGGGATEDGGPSTDARVDGPVIVLPDGALPDGALPDGAIPPGSCALVPGTTCPPLGWTLLLAAPNGFTNLIQHALAVSDDGLYLAAGGTPKIAFTAGGESFGGEGFAVAHVGFDGTLLGHDSFATARAWYLELSATGDAGYGMGGEFDKYLSRAGVTGVDAGTRTEQAGVVAVDRDSQTRWVDFVLGAPSALVSNARVPLVLPDGRMLVGNASRLELRSALGALTYTAYPALNALAYDRTADAVWMTTKVGTELRVQKLAVEDGGAGTSVLVAPSFDAMALSVRPEGGPVIAYQKGTSVEVRAFDSAGTLQWSGVTTWPAKMVLKSLAGVTGGAAIIGSHSSGTGTLFERFGSSGGAPTTRYSWAVGQDVSDLVRGPDDALYFSYGGFQSDVGAPKKLDSGGGRSVWVSRLPN